MDDEVQRDSNRLVYMREHYHTGMRNKGGAAYNILNLQYDQSGEGDYLRQKDEDSKVRALMRSKNIDTRSNCGYNLINGSNRMSVQVPFNRIYNPQGNNSQMSHVGANIMGSAPMPRSISQPHYMP